MTCSNCNNRGWIDGYHGDEYWMELCRECSTAEDEGARICEDCDTYTRVVDMDFDSYGWTPIYMGCRCAELYPSSVFLKCTSRPEIKEVA